MVEQADLDLLERNLRAIKDDIPSFKLKWKEDSWLNRQVGKVWKFWARANTTLYPCVWADSHASWEADPKRKARIMQHEWVHLKDAETFFGLLPKSLKYFNVLLFSMAYGAPQIFALLAPIALLLGAPIGHLAFLLFLLPLPAYGRMKAEMRAYRRTVELGFKPDQFVHHFLEKNYYFMWPFKKYVLREMSKPSPYKELMDKAWFDNEIT